MRLPTPQRHSTSRIRQWSSQECQCRSISKRDDTNQRVHKFRKHLYHKHEAGDWLFTVYSSTAECVGSWFTKFTNGRAHAPPSYHSYVLLACCFLLLPFSLSRLYIYRKGKTVFGSAVCMPGIHSNRLETGLMLVWLLSDRPLDHENWRRDCSF